MQTKNLKETWHKIQKYKITKVVQIDVNSHKTCRIVSYRSVSNIFQNL